MPSRSPSKQRLEELIALARTYRGWSAKDLARELGRDTHHLVPNSGVPKLDIVLALADALDWTVQDVVDDLCGNVPTAPRGKSETPDDAESFAKLNRAAWDALQAGEYERTVLVARRAYVAARTPDERGTACMREFGAWECLGRYQQAMECVQRGLGDGPTDDSVAGPLRNNLAYCHYILGEHEEAVGVATSLLADLDAGDWRGARTEPSRGFAHFVRGAAQRARIASGVDLRSSRCREALTDLALAAKMLEESGKKFDAPGYLGHASTAEGALLTLRALLDEIRPSQAIEVLSARLDEVVEPSKHRDKHALEAIGWWCVFGCEVANAKLTDDDARSHLFGVFTNKVDEIAQQTGNWALRERVWRLEVLRRLESTADVTEPWVIDRADARDLTGTMARFPKFRSIGWQVFRSAEIGDEP